MLRAAVKEGTELGIRAREFMEKGDLVPDEIVIGLIKERVTHPDCDVGFILDGFPRTVPQAEALEKNSIDIDAVINYTAPEDTIIKRLSGRRTCRKCGSVFHRIYVPEKVEGICDHCNGELYQRKDDMPEAIKIRFEEYQKKTAPLIEFYQGKKLLHIVDTDKPAEAGKINPDIIRDTETRHGQIQMTPYIRNIL